MHYIVYHVHYIVKLGLGGRHGCKRNRRLQPQAAPGRPEAESGRRRAAHRRLKKHARADRARGCQPHHLGSVEDRERPENFLLRPARARGGGHLRRARGGRPPRFWRTRATTATTPFSPSTKRIPSSSIASKSNRADISEAAPHLPGTEESITVFSGDAAVSVDGTDYPLGPRDSIRFAADRPHGYRNAGTGTVELSMVIFYGR